ncbi:flagellar basal body L-ring protein [Salinivibrio costicola subsp. alcaliphilus]|uniref:Flagellar L-ring protein n=1 Tax=Salinivibrio costicola subsp. alcaliphilus TaxID=272773 RepID=A0ABX3KTE3_SALCS|nr:flagellar basal body L-ring protein [Salinivibrio costicola subsp. alcaliphilus]
MQRGLISGLFFATLLGMGGCSLPGQQDTGSDLDQATSTTDAVEGDTTPEGEGLIGLLRQREDPKADDPSWSPIRPQQPPQHYTTATGSLFNTSQQRDLYNGSKPSGLGDIVTVMLEENTQAQKSASSDLAKSNDLSMDPLSLGGEEITIGERTLSYEVSNDNSSTGSSSADQSNSLQGSISVQVINVLANGNLMVRGEKWLTLNSGDEYIRLSGTIRPADIGPDNTIASTRISNARIQYSGTGERQDTQEQGWLARFFNVTL